MENKSFSSSDSSRMENSREIIDFSEMDGRVKSKATKAANSKEIRIIYCY